MWENAEISIYGFTSYSFTNLRHALLMKNQHFLQANLWPLLIQVDSLKKLEGIFPGNENSNTDAVDCSCILVTAPEQTDHVYNDLMDVADGPIVEMPAWSSFFVTAICFTR